VRDVGIQGFKRQEALGAARDACELGQLRMQLLGKPNAQRFVATGHGVRRLLS
jgi:hypothetical protein